MSDRVSSLDRFIEASSFPDLIYIDPQNDDPSLSATTPVPPASAKFTLKSIRWLVPAGEPLDIRVSLWGMKALSVFIANENHPQVTQLYKGETRDASRQGREFYVNPSSSDQWYLITTASKALPGRETAKNWYNGHPLANPGTDVFKKKTVWETDDSRNPGRVANITVTFHHGGYNPTFQVIS